MRPLKLTMQAFGPFSAPVALDFRDLGGRSFLLVHGPTGAGKTTILDAMCFALYGVTSGAERDPRLMRSQHAPADLPTQVVFDFALGGDHYRVSRQPEQELPRQRGEGLRKHPPSATLWKRTGLSDDADEGMVLEDRWSQVTASLVKILGFECSQFRQVIMLPQGQFRQLLTADSKEREKILEMLFQTEVYRRIQEALQTSALELRDGIKELDDRRRAVLDQAEAESVEQLEQRLAENRRLLDSAALRLETARKADAAAQSSLDRGREDSRKLAERDEAGKAFQTLLNQGPEFELKARSLQRARSADGVSQSEGFALQRRKELNLAEKALAAAAVTMKTAEETLERSARELAVEEEREPMRKEAGRRLSQLEDLAARVAELDGLRQMASGAAKDAEKRTLSRVDTAGAVDRLKAEAEAAVLKLAELSRAAEKAPVLELEKKELDTALDGRRKLDALERRASSAGKDLEQARKRLDETEKTLLAARNDLNQAETAWNGGQAALLAATLRDGLPCPVCGSRDHPFPARSDDGLPDESRLKALKSEAGRLEKERDIARQDEAGKARALDLLMSEAAHIRESLGPLAKPLLSDLEAMGKNKETELRRAETAKREAADLERRIPGLQDGLKEKTKQLELTDAELGRALQEKARAEALFRAKEAEFPDGLRTAKALEAAKDDAAGAIARLEAALKGATANHRKAAEELAAAGTARTSAAEVRHEAARRSQQQDEDFASAIRTAGFKDESDYRKALLTGDRMAALDRDIRRYHGELEAARDRAARTEKAADGLVLPNLGSLEENARTARAALENAIKEQAGLAEKVKQNETGLKHLDSIRRNLDKLEKSYYAIGRLADTAMGKNPRNLTFQRFVLAALLDDVLLAATERLRIMSAGRYRLERSADGRDRRSAWGLDLQVFDEYTGQARPVSTLSGGESFLAALSLALGLADAVQSHSGGIHLNTMFVDEGFGSLDPEALDLAIRALVDLQQGGRLVGIISHVPELKERIETRLEVTGGRSGSSARFVLG